MSTKKIGIVGWDVSAGCIGVTAPYLDWASYFGKPKILYYDEIDNDVDIVVMPGGADVNSLRYGQASSLFAGKPNVFLESFDALVLPEYIKKGIPIFGICRGMQSLSVYFGAKMQQHLYFHVHSKDTNDLTAHELVDSRYQKIKNLKVGSWHHQGVVHTPNFEMEVLAYSEPVLDRVIEAVKHPHLPIVGVQWHPERCYDSFSTDLMNSLIN
jgi:putative glutamine amidotransferase